MRLLPWALVVPLVPFVLGACAAPVAGSALRAPDQPAGAWSEGGGWRRPRPAAQWFGGATVGASFLHDDGGAPADNVDNRDLGWSVFGGYQDHPHFALVGGYADLGKLEASGPAGGGFQDEVSYDALVLLGMGLVPVHPRVQLFAAGGVAYWDQEVELVNGANVLIADEHGVSPALGIGLNVYVDPARRYALHVSYLRFFELGDAAKTGRDNDVDYVGVGVLVYR